MYNCIELGRSGVVVGVGGGGAGLHIDSSAHGCLCGIACIHKELAAGLSIRPFTHG